MGGTLRFQQGVRQEDVNRVPRWRIAAATIVLAGLVLFGAAFAPVYFRNLRLQSFVTELPARAQSGAVSDEALQQLVVNRARELNLPVTAGDVHILRTGPRASVERIDVRYQVRMNLPGYTVKLHFYPGAESK
jgi:hypothetical protein